MIYYSLLPHEEKKALRMEYRVRLAIVSLFFICCALIFGIISLIPSYVLSHSQENDALTHEREIAKDRALSGVGDMEKELVKVQAIASKIQAGQRGVSYADIIDRILSHRTQSIFISSFEIAYASGTSTPVSVILQGKALNRDTLVAFKKRLEEDGYFKNIELPLSDLAKSTDVNFALRMEVNFIKK